MKKYICLNHGECNWADEIPPREFSLDEVDINCPNCGSTNIREAVSPPRIDWKKITIIAAVVLLLLGSIWTFTSSSPLHISAKTNCTNSTVIISTMDGNGKPIMFYSPELGGKTQTDTVFSIPSKERMGATLTFWAVQNDDSVKTSLVTNCPISGIYPPGERNTQDPPNNDRTREKTKSLTWTMVEGSGFCDPSLDGTYLYSERNNLGQIRERKILNRSGCYPANQ